MGLLAGVLLSCLIFIPMKKWYIAEFRDKLEQRRLAFENSLFEETPPRLVEEELQVGGHYKEQQDRFKEHYKELQARLKALQGAASPVQRALQGAARGTESAPLVVEKSSNYSTIFSPGLSKREWGRVLYSTLNSIEYEKTTVPECVQCSVTEYSSSIVENEHISSYVTSWELLRVKVLEGANSMSC